LLDKVLLVAVLGDQQAVLFGQFAFAPGQAKNTYSVGLFFMMNIGTKPIPSRHGLLTKRGYQMDDYYSLEGSVPHWISTIQ
jgi:glycerol kinase